MGPGAAGEPEPQELFRVKTGEGSCALDVIDTAYISMWSRAVGFSLIGWEAKATRWLSAVELERRPVAVMGEEHRNALTQGKSSQVFHGSIRPAKMDIFGPSETKPG